MAHGVGAHKVGVVDGPDGGGQESRGGGVEGQDLLADPAGLGVEVVEAEEPDDQLLERLGGQAVADLVRVVGDPAEHCVPRRLPRQRGVLGARLVQRQHRHLVDAQVGGGLDGQLGHVGEGQHDGLDLAVLLRLGEAGVHGQLEQSLRLTQRFLQQRVQCQGLLLR